MYNYTKINLDVKVVLQFFKDGIIWSDEKYYTDTNINNIEKIKLEVDEQFPQYINMSYVAEVIDEYESIRYLIIK